MATGDLDRIFVQYLVTRVRAGSREAFDELVRYWTPRLLRFSVRTVGRSEMARDIVQETWIGVIRGLRGLDDPASFPAWIYGIAQRKCVDAIRTTQRWRKVSGRVQQYNSDMDLSASVSDVAGRQVDLAAAVAELPEDQRKVVNLYYGEDLDVAEIAVAIDVPVGTVKSRLFHARQFLKRFLGGSNEQH